MAPFFKICFVIFAVNLELINGTDNKLSMLTYDTNVALLHTPKIITFQSQKDLSADIKTLVNYFDTHYEKDELDLKLDDITINRFKLMATKIAELPKFIGHMGRSHISNEKLICAIKLDGLKAKLSSLLSIGQNSLKKDIPMEQGQAEKVKRNANSERAREWIEHYHNVELVPQWEKQQFYGRLIFEGLSRLTNVGLDLVLTDLENESVLPENSVNRLQRKNNKLIKIQTLLANIHNLDLPVRITREKTRFNGVAQTFIDRANVLSEIQMMDDRNQKLKEFLTELRDNGNKYPIPILDRIAVVYDLKISTNESRDLKAIKIISYLKQKFELPDSFLDKITIGGDIPGQKRNRIDETIDEQVTKRNKMTSEQPEVIENDIDLETDQIDSQIQTELDNREAPRDNDQSAREILDSDLIDNTDDNEENEIDQVNDVGRNNDNINRMVSDEPTVGEDNDNPIVLPQTGADNNAGKLLQKVPLLINNDIILDGRVDSNSAAVIKQIIDSVLLHDLPDLSKKYSVSELSNLCDYQNIYYVEYNERNEAMVYTEKILGSKLKPVPFCSEQFCHELVLSHTNIDLVTGQTCQHGKQLDNSHYVCETKLQLDRTFCDRTHTPTTECVFTQYEETNEISYFNHDTALLNQKTNQFSQNLAEKELDITINGTKYTLQPKSRAFLTVKKPELQFFLTTIEIALEFDKPDTIVGQVKQILATIPQVELVANVALGIGSLAGIYSLMQLFAFIIRKGQEIFSGNNNPRVRHGTARTVYELGTRGLRRVDNTEN